VVTQSMPKATRKHCFALSGALWRRPCSNAPGARLPSPKSMRRSGTSSFSPEAAASPVVDRRIFADITTTAGGVRGLMRRRGSAVRARGVTTSRQGIRAQRPGTGFSMDLRDLARTAPRAEAAPFVRALERRGARRRIRKLRTAGSRRWSGLPGRARKRQPDCDRRARQTRRQVTVRNLVKNLKRWPRTS